MRLIDADALLYDLEVIPLTGDGGVDANDLNEIIKRQPTVEDRKKGKWYREVLCSTSGYGTMVMYQCSNCENLAISDYCFCPNCGADMRGSE